MDYLVDLGALDGSKFQPKSFGEERPVDRRSNEEAWAKNRRAEFKLTCGGN
jgi:peptidoglycan-associated lipoprotein